MPLRQSLPRPPCRFTIEPEVWWNRPSAGPLSSMHDPADSPLLPGAGKMRQRMVERQLVRRGIADRRVLDAMRTVPREAFVAKHLARSAYDDRALPIEAGQTISQP